MRTLAALCLFAVAAVACAKPLPETKKSRAKTMEQCTKTIRAGGSLADEIAALPPRGVLCLEPGTYAVNLVIDKPLTLRGVGAPGDTILDGGGRASVVRVGDGASAVLERLTITGGANRDGGGGVHCGGGDVALRDVVLRGNRAEAFGGAALYAGAGRVTLERCRVVDNAGGVGGAIIADGVATVTLRQTLVAGNEGSTSAIYVHDNAELILDHATVAGNRAAAALEVRAIAIRAPSVTIGDSIVSGGAAIRNGPRLSGRVDVARSLIDGAQSGVTDGGGNRTGAPQFTGEGAEPWRPKAGSPAIGIAHTAQSPDLAGSAPGTTAGAFQPAS